VIRTSAVNGPALVSSVQRPSAKRAARTSVDVRTSSGRASSERYAWISACGAKRRDQRGFGAKENSYRCDGMSQAAPGYVLWCQTPPTRSERSNTVASV
jgi:hypothetical protein